MERSSAPEEDQGSLLIHLITMTPSVIMLGATGWSLSDGNVQGQEFCPFLLFFFYFLQIGKTK